MGEGMISEITTHISHPESAVFTLRFYRNRWWMHKRRHPKTRSNQGTMSCILTAAKKKGDIKKKKRERIYFN
jgi:hypothetical protein